MINNKKIKSTPKKLTTKYPSPDTSIINLDPLKDIKKHGKAYAKVIQRFESITTKTGHYKCDPICLVCIPENKKGADNIICLNVKDLYNNAIDLVLMLANKLVAMDVCLKTIVVSDKATYYLLREFCDKAGIGLELEDENDVDEGMKDILTNLVYNANED